MSDLNAKIIPLHSEVEGRVPTPEQVEVGEIALSLADKKIYSKNSSGEIVVLGDVGEVDGLPGGGFKLNSQESDNTLDTIYRFNVRGTATSYGWSYSSSQFDTNSSGYDRNGDTFNVRPYYQQKIDVEGADRIYVATENPWLGDEVDWTELTFTSSRFTSSQPYNYFFGVPTGLANLEDPLLTEIWVSFGIPGEFIPIPLADGDALRYDGNFWRPIKYKLSALDDVDGEISSSAGVMGWVFGPLVSGNVPEGGVAQGTGGDVQRLKFHAIDDAGVDRRDDWAAWLSDLRGSTWPDGDQLNLTVTLHLWIDGVRYEITANEFDDDDRDGATGQDLRTWQIESDFFTLYPNVLTQGSRIEIEEFSNFLGITIGQGGLLLEQGDVLQYNDTTKTWTAQPLNFNLDEAANVALRVDSGSGTEIPKAVGDALLWDGTNWTPSSPLSGSSISALGDVNTVTTSPSDGQALVWDNANGYWKPGTVASDAPDVALNDLTDTTLTTPEQDQFLKYVNGVWVNAALVYADVSDAPTVPQNIGDLGDVDLSLAPVTGQALVWDGSAWKPADQTGGGGSGDTVVGALTERADVSVTESFTTGQTKNVQFSGLGEAGKFVQVTVSFPAWVRFYATANDRDADALRAVDEDPIAGSGVLMELRTTTADEVVKITPGAVYYNNDSLPSQVLYARITNETGSTTSITTTVRSYTSTSTDAIDGGIFGSG